MTGPQFAVGLLVVKQVINDDQDTVGQGHDGFLAAHPFGESPVVSSQAGVLAAPGSVGRLDEGLFEPVIAVADPGAQLFARANLGGRA
jgi:hypothetical protein